MENQKYMDVDDEIMLFCAFRYALGRKTYVVSTVANRMISKFNEIDPINRKKYVEEIDVAEKNNDLGWDCDINDWLRVRALFTPENHCMVHTFLSEEDMKNNIIHSTSPAVRFQEKYFTLDMKAHYHTCKEINKEVVNV
jgi:hypothetical protein